MEYKDLIIEKSDYICHITINREDHRNAISPHTWQELDRIVTELENEESTRVAIIRGAGDKTFAAGADLKAMKTRTAQDIMESKATDTLIKMEESRVVYIASINGYALGGGCELALACDIRIGSDNAIFGQPEVNLSLIPAGGGTQRLPRIIGESRAKDMILTGKIIDAEEAYRIGLITEICSLNELDDVTRKKANEICSKGPLAIEFSKKSINQAFISSKQGYLTEKLFQSYLINSEDAKEGINAFLEKRPPRFIGK